MFRLLWFGGLIYRRCNVNRSVSTSSTEVVEVVVVPDPDVGEELVTVGIGC